jgi:hypothetical protein
MTPSRTRFAHGRPRRGSHAGRRRVQAGCLCDRRTRAFSTARACACRVGGPSGSPPPGSRSSRAVAAPALGPRVFDTAGAMLASSPPIVASHRPASAWSTASISAGGVTGTAADRDAATCAMPGDRSLVVITVLMSSSASTGLRAGPSFSWSWPGPGPRVPTCGRAGRGRAIPPVLVGARLGIKGSYRNRLAWCRPRDRRRCPQ